MKKLSILIIILLLFVQQASISEATYQAKNENIFTSSELHEPTGDVQNYEYDYRLVSSETKTVYAGYAGRQPANGTKFPNTGSGFYWSDWGYESNVSVSVSYGVFSLSVSAGSIGTGYYINVPVANVYAKLQVFRDVKVSKYHVYRRRWGTSTWNYYTTEYRTNVVGVSFNIVYL